MLYFPVVVKAQTISIAAGTVTWTLDGNSSIAEVELDESSGSHGDDMIMNRIILYAAGFVMMQEDWLLSIVPPFSGCTRAARFFMSPLKGRNTRHGRRILTGVVSTHQQRFIVIQLHYTYLTSYKCFSYLSLP